MRQEMYTALRADGYADWELATYTGEFGHVYETWEDYMESESEFQAWKDDVLRTNAAKRRA